MNGNEKTDNRAPGLHRASIHNRIERVFKDGNPKTDYLDGTCHLLDDDNPL